MKLEYLSPALKLVDGIIELLEIFLEKRIQLFVATAYLEHSQYKLEKKYKIKCKKSSDRLSGFYLCRILEQIVEVVVKLCRKLRKSLLISILPSLFHNFFQHSKQLINLLHCFGRNLVVMIAFNQS